MRDRDWSTSPLGAPSAWVPALKVVAGIILDANQPMFVAWGPERTLIYNDGYAEILGAHHPLALGRPFLEAWPELVESVGPLLDRAYGGEPIHMDDIELVMHRKGFEEETHFSFFYAPVREESGEVGGILCACNETTKLVMAKRERREAETRNRQILDSAVDYAIVATDLDGDVTRWNEGARRIFGWDEAEVLGRSIELIFTPEDLAHGRPWVEMRRAAETGVGDDNRFHARKDGQHFWASGEMTPLRNEAGTIVGFVKVLRDRTEQKLADRRLAESEARFRGLAEATPGFVWTASPDGRLTYTSAGWHAYSGAEIGHAKGEAWIGFIHPEDRKQALRAWQQSIMSGDLYETEFRLRAADGSYRWWLARALLTRDEAGATAFWAGVCTEIQTIVTAREALSRSHEELEARVAERTSDRNRMWRLSRDAMLVARFDRSIAAINPAMTVLLGWSEQDMLGFDLMQFVDAGDIPSTQGAIDSLAGGATVLNFENRCRHKDGTTRWMRWTAVPDDGFLHAIGRDVTAEKEQAEVLARTEEALRQSQKMDAVGQLTGGLAHDFNNLLTGISGSLELLEKRLGQGRVDGAIRYISTARAAAGRAAALTHRLLAFSRRQTLDPRAVNVNALVAAMEELIQRTVGPEIMLSTTLASDLWPTLCDPSQLDNAILNLCINARDAMPAGGSLRIETANLRLEELGARERDMLPGEYVSVNVTDTGIGMTQEVSRRATEPFFTTKPLGLGTGLGLSMIYGFAKQSGGQIRIHSEVGKGTTVRVYLPRHDGPVTSDDARLDAVAPSQRGEGRTVLVVDDEPSVRMLVLEVLEQQGYATAEAVDGASGLKLMKTDMRIDLLVSDVGMPGGMNGRQMADAARVTRPDLKVLFITGYAEKAAVGDGNLGHGMYVLTKPFAMDALAERVRAIIDGG